MIPFDLQTKTQLYQALQSAFPDAHVSPADLVALALCLKSGLPPEDETIPPELRQIDLGPYAAQLASLQEKIPDLEKHTVTPKPSNKVRYYWAKAQHTRLTPSGFDPFTGELPLVRVSLPESAPAQVKTAIGSFEPADHLIATVFEANQKYEKNLGYPLERIDCITPPRQGVRFGAVSVMLGYRKKKDPLPSCYILEAGTATGQPKVLYLGKTIGTVINAYSGYQPSPFACPSHAYIGQLSLNGDHPKILDIKARAIQDGVSQTPYMHVHVDFSPQAGQVSTIWPGFLIARAAGIVLARKCTGKIPEDCNPQLPGAVG